MGSDYDDLGFSADWLVVDLMPKDPAKWTRELVQLCDPARPTTRVAGGPGRQRFEFMLLAGETKAEMNKLATAWRPLRGGICILDAEVAAGRDAFLLGPGVQQQDRYPASSLPPSPQRLAGDGQAGELPPQGRVQLGDRAGRFDDVADRGFVLRGWTPTRRPRSALPSASLWAASVRGCYAWWMARSGQAMPARCRPACGPASDWVTCASWLARHPH